MDSTIEEIVKTCSWKLHPEDSIKVKITELSKGVYMIAVLEDTAITIHCSEERDHRYEGIKSGNTELHVKDDCMVEEMGMDPKFKILPTRTMLKNSTYNSETQE